MSQKISFLVLFYHFLKLQEKLCRIWCIFVHCIIGHIFKQFWPYLGGVQAQKPPKKQPKRTVSVVTKRFDNRKLGNYKSHINEICPIYVPYMWIEGLQRVHRKIHQKILWIYWNLDLNMSLWQFGKCSNVRTSLMLLQKAIHNLYQSRECGVSELPIRGVLLPSKI